MRKLLVCSAALLAFATGPLHAQSWEAPTFFSPRPGEDIGVYAIQPDGADWGIAAIWRQSGNLNLGVRAGLVEDHIQIGAEFYQPLNLLGPQSPILLSWLLGVGATFNDVTHLRVPLGISAGVRLGSPGSIQLLPYVHPRVAFDLFAIDVGDEEEVETEFNLDIDVGADIVLSRSFVLRVGATFGESDAFGAGIAYRIPRRVAVR